MEGEEEEEKTDQEDQRVAARSKGPRLEMCWLGRQEIRAVMLPGAVGGLYSSSVEVMLDFGEVLDVDGEGVSVKSTSSHQSISVTFLTPESRNHFLLPNGAKKWQFGCLVAICVMVGWERWS